MTMPVLLLTRPVRSAHSFADGLKSVAVGKVTLLISPLIAIVPMDVKPDLSRYGGVILSSANGARLAPLGDQRLAYCVGATTAEVAMLRGWHVAKVAKTANHLIDWMSAQTLPAPLVHLAGEHRRGEIAERLTAIGTMTDVVTLYRQDVMPLSQDAQDLLVSDTATIVPLFSPRTAEQFVQDGQVLNNVTVVAISDAVADVVGTRSGVCVYTAAAPTGSAMTELVEKRLTCASLP